MVTPLGKAIEFFRDFGLFDVVLPFLLVFTITFAIFEKTRILGTVKIKDSGEVPNKNLNAMASFVIALLVVATANVVRAINESLPNIVLLVVAAVSFLLMIGVFSKTEEMDFRSKHKGWYTAFVIIMFVAVVAIFINSIYDKDGNSYLEILAFLIIENWSGAAIAAILVLGVILFAIYYVTKSPGKKEKEAS